jgi:OmpR-family two-component system manganese-sensing response regulator
MIHLMEVGVSVAEGGLMPTDVCVVIVDDEEEVRAVLKELLDLEGYDAIGVGHPQCVLALARQTDPDLFFIDIMLPDKSGIEVAQELRENGFQTTPMIGMSASSIMASFAQESRLFQAVVEKPFDVDALFAQVARLLAG